MSLRWKLRRDQIPRSVIAHLGGALVMWLIWGSTGALVARVINRIPPTISFRFYYLTLLLTILPFCLLLYFAVVGCVHAFTYYVEAREREAQQSQLAAQLAEARLSALRSQLNPHFLFNSLNAITVLVRDQNTQDASRMLELLSGVLRQVLQNEKRQEVALSEELEFVRKYLAIEEVRFSDRLQLRWSIEPAVEDALVPEFILQPLVENAIRHGITRQEHNGIIEITARGSADTLVLTVQDNGPGYRPVNDGGVGLANTRARLATVFGDRAELNVASADSGGTVATLRFPLKK
jgi:LytS/YehU family sensor histidine kinase